MSRKIIKRTENPIKAVRRKPIVYTQNLKETASSKEKTQMGTEAHSLQESATIRPVDRYQRLFTEGPNRPKRKVKVWHTKLHHRVGTINDDL